MKPEDVALSKGQAPAPVDPKRVVRDVMGRPVGYWQGQTTTK